MESGEITDAQLNSSSNMGSLSGASNSRLNLQLMSPVGVAMGAWYALQQSEEYWLQVDFVTLHVISAVSHTYSAGIRYVNYSIVRYEDSGVEKKRNLLTSDLGDGKRWQGLFTIYSEKPVAWQL